MNNLAIKGCGLKVWLLAAVWCLTYSIGANAEDEPTSLADQLVEQAKEIERIDINDAIKMMHTREHEVVQVASTKELARYYNKLSELNSTIGDLANQQLYADKGLQLLGGETVAIAADLNYNRGLVFEMKADFASALQLYRKGLKIAQTTNHLLYQGRGQLFISAIYSSEGNYERALETMKVAYSISEQVDNLDLKWEVLNEMGLLYGHIGDEEHSLEFYMKALKASQALNIKDLIVVALHNVAMTHIFLKDYEQANFYFDKMLDESKTSTQLSNMYLSYKGFALSAAETGQYKTALTYLTKAQEYLANVQQVLTQVDFYVIKADILSELDQTHRALEVLGIAEQILPPSERGKKSRIGTSIIWYKSLFFSELGQYEEAYKLLKEHAEALKERRRIHSDAAVNRLRVSFDMERNEIRNNVLEKENEIKALELSKAQGERQVQTFFLIALALLSLGLIFVMYRQLDSRRQLKAIAQTDSLTNLYNRRYAFLTGESLVKENQLDHSALSVIVFDLDNFKGVNDTYGHPAGDVVLKHIAEVGKACLRGTDVLSRIDGEEFLAVLPGVKLEMAEFIAGRLKDKIESYQHQHEQSDFNVTASFGVAMVSQTEDFDTLIQRADKALCKAKDNGRNCVALA
jgi:diguanylate cyclase (GGDEF)-like protein